MSGKIFLVTGATSGIGQIIAVALAARGAEVVMTGRNQQGIEQSFRQIKADTGNEAVRSLPVDFSDLQQVRALAGTFKQGYSRLDVLVNNARTFSTPGRTRSLALK